jgi:hypothetical protein
MTQPLQQSPKPGWLAIEERKALREPFDASGDVVGDRVPASSVRVVDLSSLGCKVESERPIVAGRFVSPTIFGFDFKGWVVWTSEDGYGVDFAHPVPDRVVAHLLERRGVKE